jgi:hypothetical protein
MSGNNTEVSAPSSQSIEHCEYERDSVFSWCLAPWRFAVIRADGDQTYSGGREPGVYYCCEQHLADAVAGMADGDSLGLTVTIRYDEVLADV